MVGTPQQKEICLTSHDLHVEKGLPAWNQEMVQNEIGVNGFWAIEVAQKGIYAFELRRFPREHNAAFPAKYRKAKISTNGKEQEIKMLTEAQQVTFQITLPKGNHQLKTWFLESYNKSIEAAYVYVKQIK